MTDSAVQKIKVCGQENPELAQKLLDSLEKRITTAQREFTKDEIYYVSKVNLELLNSNLNVDDKTLERLRQLCQLWDVDFKPVNLTSHRKFIGPIIVTAKKLIIPIVRTLLKDVLEKQRLFNAAAISLLAQLANQKK